MFLLHPNPWESALLPRWEFTNSGKENSLRLGSQISTAVWTIMGKLLENLWEHLWIPGSWWSDLIRKRWHPPPQAISSLLWSGIFLFWITGYLWVFCIWTFSEGINRMMLSEGPWVDNGPLMVQVQTWKKTLLRFWLLHIIVLIKGQACFIRANIVLRELFLIAPCTPTNERGGEPWVSEMSEALTKCVLLTWA